VKRTALLQKLNQQGAILTVDDIHNVRLQMAEEYSKMSPENAEHDFQQRVARSKQAIAAFRHSEQLTHDKKIISTDINSAIRAF
jgi:hypothetical protein